MDMDVVGKDGVPVFGSGFRESTRGWTFVRSLEVEASELQSMDTPLRNRVARSVADYTPDPAASVGTTPSGEPRLIAACKWLPKDAPRCDVALAMATVEALSDAMRLEEQAIICGDSAAPMGYDGLLKLVSVENGTPAEQIVEDAGEFRFDLLDLQLSPLLERGIQRPWIAANPQEVLSMARLAEGSGSTIRVTTTGANQRTVLGVLVIGYMNPFTGEMVDIITSRFIPAGTILIGCDIAPNGTPPFDIHVIPPYETDGVGGKGVQGYALYTTVIEGREGVMAALNSRPRLLEPLCFSKITGIKPIPKD